MYVCHCFSLEHRKWQVLQLVVEAIRTLERLANLCCLMYMTDRSYLLFLFLLVYLSPDFFIPSHLKINIGLAWSIISMLKLGPGESKSTTVRLLPLVAGLHELTGCYVVDMRTTREFKQRTLANLLISTPDWRLIDRYIQQQKKVIVKNDAAYTITWGMMITTDYYLPTLQRRDYDETPSMWSWCCERRGGAT